MERLGIALGSGLSPDQIVRCVQLAEECGYDSAWIVEGHGGDQFSLLTACALATKKIRLGTAISSVFVRTAPTVAMAAACVDYFSKGRFVLGLGSSHKVQVEPEHGQVYTKPLERVRDYVTIVRRLLRDGRISYSGATVTIADFQLWFRPLRQELPIYLAAVFPQMLQLAGEIAQGVLLVWMAPSYMQFVAEQIAIGAGRAGRKLGDIQLASLLPASVSGDEKAAFDALRPVAAFYLGTFPRYRKMLAGAGFADEAARVQELWKSGDQANAAASVSDALIETVTIAGSPARCRQRLAAYRAAGLQLPILMPAASGPESEPQVMAAIRGCAPNS